MRDVGCRLELVMAAMALSAAFLVPVPAAALYPERTYIAFFDEGSSTLTERDRHFMREVALLYQRYQNQGRPCTRVTVQGHASDPGSPEDNRALSARRAATVAAELVRNGVPAELLEVTAYGADNPLAPADAPGSPQQNRRVEVFCR